MQAASIFGDQVIGLPNGQDQVVKSPPVARVYDQFLYKSDLDHLTTEATSPKDRAEMNRYIHSWIAK